MLKGYAGAIVEPLIEPPTPPLDTPWLDPLGPEHCYHHAAGHAHVVGYDAAPCRKPPTIQCVGYNFGCCVQLNEFARSYMNKPSVELLLSEEAPRPSEPRLLSVSKPADLG